jgi:hypothetical protein
MILEYPNELKWRGVKNYLEKQKLRTGNDSDELNEIFDLQDFVCSLRETLSRFRGELTDIRVFKCSTFAANTQIIFNARDTAVGIIYDFALSETLHALNLFYLHRAGEVDYQKYACKLLAEYFYNQDMHHDALQMVRSYGEVHYTIQNDLDDTAVSKARNYAAIQQLFIIFHEVGHLLFSKGIVPKSTSEVIRGVLCDIVTASYEVANAEITERDDLLQRIRTNSTLVGECCCDTYALELLFFTIKKVQSKYDFLDIAEASYLTLSYQKYKELVKGAAYGKR